MRCRSVITSSNCCVNDEYATMYSYKISNMIEHFISSMINQKPQYHCHEFHQMALKTICSVHAGVPVWLSQTSAATEN